MTICSISPDVILDSSLLKAYEEECANPLLGPTNPDRGMYEAMAKTGILACFGCFESDRMVGFATVLITVYPHYSKKVATVESLYAVRGGSALKSTIKQFAKMSGCTEILYSAPIGGRFEKLLQASKSCVRTSSIFGERLV